MAVTAKEDITLIRGNSVNISFKIWQTAPSGVTLGVPQDLTGKVLAFRAAWLAPTEGQLTKTSAGGDIIFTDQEEGEALMVLTFAETRLLPAGVVIEYELEYRDGSDQRTVKSGFINAVGGVNSD